MSLGENELRSMLNSMPVYRHRGIPERPEHHTVVFLDEDHFVRTRHILDKFRFRPTVTLVETTSPASELSERLGETVNLLPFALKQVGKEVTVCSESTTRPMLHRMIMAIWRNGRNSYWLSDFKGPSPQPYLFDEHRERIVRIVNHLSDEQSVSCYLARLKALMMGDPGYQIMSSYFQYWHPIVRAKPGDIVCDGGIGTEPHTPIAFAKTVGEKGRVFGFEPIRGMCSSLAAKARSWPTIEMVPKGLWSKSGNIEMTVAGNISTFRAMDGTSALPKELCDLTSIDEYFEERKLTPSLIKMDIEGAERFALLGAEKTIRQSAPKLQICLYHSVEDFLSIPLQILDYRPDYRIYIGHHTPFFNECVVYAIAPETA